MRNSFARIAKRETTRPSLRERLTATKARAKQVLVVNAVSFKGPPKPVPEPILPLMKASSEAFKIPEAEGSIDHPMKTVATMRATLALGFPSSIARGFGRMRRMLLVRAGHEAR